MSTPIEIPDEILARLTQLAESTGRATDHLARQALLEYLDDQEDYLIAMERLKKGGPRLPFEDLEQELGLER
ncbi:MAG: anti-toxin [Acidobacteria bacterium]|nr:anti-toxin [Acidobacteriota bacterium]